MYKKIYISIALGFLALLFCTACSQDSVLDDQPLEKGNLTLTFNCSSESSEVSRSEVVEEEGNDYENKLKKIDCFFYPLSAGDDAEATYKLSFSLNTSKVATVHANLSNEVLKELFTDGATKCHVYVIANLPSDIKIENTSRKNLKSLKLTSSFEKVQSYIDNKTLSFVMDSNGNDEVTYNEEQKKVSGKVELTRVASKVMLTITEVKEVKDDQKITWKADVKNMHVLFYNGVNKTRVNAPYKIQAEDYYELTSGNFVPFVTDVDGESKEMYEQPVPFYSYPSDWNSDGREVYMLLVVPWKSQKGESDSYMNCYYQLPVNPKENKLERNQFYKINLSVSTLGATDPIKPTLLRPSCTILDWNHLDIDAELRYYRYLVIEPSVFVLKNQNRIEIPYGSSHDIEFAPGETTCTRINLSKIEPEDDLITDGYSLEIDSLNNTIIYERKLDNDYLSDTFDFTPYTLTFKVWHKDKHEYFKDVKIIQYPAIYAYHERNSDFISQAMPDTVNNKHQGYVFVNGYYSTGKDQHYNSADNLSTSVIQDIFGSAAGIQGQLDDFSPNRYVFTITSNFGTEYVIGDPREQEPSMSDEKVFYYPDYVKHAKKNTRGKLKGITSEEVNDAEQARSAWVKAPGINGGEMRGLKYYYATDNGDATRNLIAPKFRIASSYGSAYVDRSKPAHALRTLDGVKKRCASYQEDGYPAGRWRLPTEAEFKFIIQLANRESGSNKLPAIYNLGRPYWCAHGLGIPQKNSNGKVTVEYKEPDGKAYSVRCVYDDWYWKDKLNGEEKEKFVWGDEPRR